MGEKINFNVDKNIIFIFNNTKQIWEDKTNSISALYTSYYYAKFTGYDVYYKGAKSKFFYKVENIEIINFVKNISLKNIDAFIDDSIVDAIKIDEFQFGYYRVVTPTNNLITKNLKLKKALYKNVYEYYKDLANYALTISNENEPLYFLSNNYQRINPSRNSVLFQYLNGLNILTQKDNLIIVPFDYNQSQYKAIETALNNSISIIEGPPGTGKTQAILNLLTNIIFRGENCAIVSNNNTAIDNVYEKLISEGFSFIAASLGRTENVDRFFKSHDDENLLKFLDSEIDNHEEHLISKITDLSYLMKLIHEKEINLAKLHAELNEILVEHKYFISEEIPMININERLQANDYLNLIKRLEETRKIRFIERLRINHKYKIKIKNLNLSDLIIKLESLIYEKKIKGINKEIELLNYSIAIDDKETINKRLKQLSKYAFLKQVKKHYQNLKEIVFNKESYKHEYNNFIKRYPVILSTSQSLLNNAPKEFLFDYLIIDEASQGDLLSSVLAMSCAKKIVVVGDSRQLQQIDEERLFEKSKELAIKYNIFDCYRYDSNSILKSVKEAINDVPITLLKEHYRCALDIISFCNKMFYNNELIPMTSNQGSHIQIIKTVPGNHARKNPKGSGMYNQREIDELEYIIGNKDISKIGVITPFRYQAKLIREKYHNLEADTIHKYQGRQKDEIILSFVVNSLEKNPDQIENKLYDFITNEKLLNVAISRAKNNITIIISDKLYYSNNNIIKDFINYAEYLYGDSITKEANTRSVFDCLYSDYNKFLIKKYQENPQNHQTELIMAEIINNLLIVYKTITYQMHARLSRIIRKIDGFNEDEKRYILHPWSHVDFFFYNKVTKEKLFVLEVDGIRYHEQNEKQSLHDDIKNRALTLNDIPLYRFKTNESNENKRLIEILNKYTY